MPTVLIVVLGCAAVLLLDLVGGLASRRFGFRYALLAPLSLVLYGGTAYLAAGEAGAWLAGPVAGMTVAAVDASVGWWLSRALGIEESAAISELDERAVAGNAIALGAIIGGLAGLIA